MRDMVDAVRCALAFLLMARVVSLLSNNTRLEAQMLKADLAPGLRAWLERREKR